MRWLPWAVLVALLLFPKKAGKKGIRSIRNNNPGNIKLTNINWKGKVPNNENTDKVFEQFRTYQELPGMTWGTRAMIKELIDSIINDGNRNVPALINDWASGDSLATRQNYAAYVSNMTNIGPAQYLEADKGTLRKLVFVMADWEAGLPTAPAVTFDLFEQAYPLAFA